MSIVFYHKQIECRVENLASKYLFTGSLCYIHNAKFPLNKFQQSCKINMRNIYQLKSHHYKQKCKIKNKTNHT